MMRGELVCTSLSVLRAQTSSSFPQADRLEACYIQGWAEQDCRLKGMHA